MIDHAYSPNSSDELALFARDNFVGEGGCPYKLGNQVRVVNSRYLNETTLKVRPIDCAYYPKLPSQIALFARDNP